MRAVAIALLAILAGCVSPAPAATLSTPVLEGTEAGWSHLRVGDFLGAEPSVGVTSSGTIFIAGAYELEDLTIGVGARLVRSTDGGATWETVGDVATDPKMNIDPWMWLDRDTDRVFNVPLHLACSWAQWSDDEGDTWLANPAVACLPPSHDHQKLVTGPPAAGVATVGYPNVVYYAYNSLLVTGTTGILGVPSVADARLGTIVSTSLDGGLTFSPGKIIHESGCHRGIVGPPAVAPDGTVYIPHGTCEGIDVMVSHDSGSTWETASIDSVGSLDDFAFDPGVAVDEAGTAYLVWPGADALLYLSTSADAGKTWSEPTRITAEGVNATVFSSIVSYGAGRVAVAYLATERDPSGWEQRASSFADEGTVWNLHVTLIEDGVATTHRLTTDADPVQRGCVWMRGGQSDCRNLYDFITIVQGPDALYLSYVDGCAACASASESRRGDLMLATLPLPAARTT